MSIVESLRVELIFENKIAWLRFTPLKSTYHENQGLKSIDEKEEKWSSSFFPAGDFLKEESVNSA